MFDYLKRSFRFAKPIYNELSTYMTALTCVVLFFAYPGFRQAFYLFLSSMVDINSTSEARGMMYIILFALLLMSGLILSIIHVFINREKDIGEKYCMGAFAVAANATAATAAGVEQLLFSGGVTSLIILFPLWNIITGIVMLYQLGTEKFDVTDENAALLEVAVVSVVLLMVFAVAYFIFDLTAAMTFSICISYSYSIHPFVIKALHRVGLRAGV